MELTGKVTLDDSTMEKLKEEVREDVIKDIIKNGNYSSEIKRYLLECNFESYYKMIASTLEDVLDMVDESQIHFKCEETKLKKLKLIQEIIDL